jgi:hypothetical protein
MYVVLHWQVARPAVGACKDDASECKSMVEIKCSRGFSAPLRVKALIRGNGAGDLPPVRSPA